MKRHHKFGLGTILVLALLLTAPASIAHEDDPLHVMYECSTHLDDHVDDLAKIDGTKNPERAKQLAHAVKRQVVNMLNAIRVARETDETVEWLRECLRVVMEDLP